MLLLWITIWIGIRVITIMDLYLFYKFEIIIMCLHKTYDSLVAPEASSFYLYWIWVDLFIFNFCLLDFFSSLTTISVIYYIMLGYIFL